MKWELHLYLCQENVLNTQIGCNEYDLILKADTFWSIWFPFPSKSQILAVSLYLQKNTVCGDLCFFLWLRSYHDPEQLWQPLSQGPFKEWRKLSGITGGNPFSGQQSVKGCCHFGRKLLIKSLQASISQMNHTEEGLGQGVSCPAWISSVTRTPVSLHCGISFSRSQRGQGSFIHVLVAFPESRRNWAWGHSGNTAGLG